MSSLWQTNIFNVTTTPTGVKGTWYLQPFLIHQQVHDELHLNSLDNDALVLQSCIGNRLKYFHYLLVNQRYPLHLRSDEDNEHQMVTFSVLR